MLKIDDYPRNIKIEEWLVADASKWGAYGLIALLDKWPQIEMPGRLSPVATLNYLSSRGSVNGVTGQNTLTGDSMAVREGIPIIEALRTMTSFTDNRSSND